MTTPFKKKIILINRKWSTKSLSSGTSGFTACEGLDCDLLPKLITIWKSRYKQRGMSKIYGLGVMDNMISS